MKRKYNPELKYDPELDFTSEHFNAAKSLEFDIPLPYPKAKKYDNLADWFNHTFRKKIRLTQNKSKNSSKNDVYILKRNYEWYYKTFGLHLPYNFNEEKQCMKEIKRRRDQYGNFKIVNVKVVDPIFLEPLRSSKIIVKRNGFLQKYIRINREDKTNGNVLSKHNNFQDIKPNISYVESKFGFNDHENINNKCKVDSNISAHCNSVAQTVDCNIISKTKKVFSEINESNMLSSFDKQKESSQIEINSLKIKDELSVRNKILETVSHVNYDNSKIKVNFISTQDNINKKSFSQNMCAPTETLDNSSANDKTNEESPELVITYMSTAENSTVFNQKEKNIQFKNKKSRKTRSNESQRKSSRANLQSHVKATLEMENLPKDNNSAAISDSDVENNSLKSVLCLDDNSGPERKTRSNKSPRKQPSTKFISHKKFTLEIENLIKTKEVKNSDSSIEINSPKSIIVCSDDNSSPERKKFLNNENLNGGFSNYQEEISDINEKLEGNCSFIENDEKQRKLKVSSLSSTLNTKHKLDYSFNEKNNSRKQEKSISQRRPLLKLNSNVKIRFGETDKDSKYIEISENPASSNAHFKSRNNGDIDNAKTKLNKITESEHNEENKPETVPRNSNPESTSEEIFIILDTAINRKDVKELPCHSGSVLKSVENSNCYANTRKIDLNENYELDTKNISSIFNKSSDSIKSTGSDKEMSLLELARKARNKLHNVKLL